MSNSHIVFEVARWEFSRWFKWKGQIATLLISAGVSLLFWGGRAIMGDGKDEPVRIAVIGLETLPVGHRMGSRLTLFAANPKDEPSLRDSVGFQTLNGLLKIQSPDSAELIVLKDPSWLRELTALVSEVRRKTKMQELHLSSAQLEDVLRPTNFSVTIHEAARPATTVAEKAAAVIVLVLMLFGIFTSFAYQFVTITGEKQLHVTELMMSAISTQQWMDGKIIGIACLSIVTTATNALGVLLFVGISQAFGSEWSIPVEFSDPFVLFTLAVCGFGGFLLWNTFNAAMAATINDPNTSAKGTLMLLPVVPVAMSVFAFGNPDSVIVRILSVFPLTSPPLLSARVVMTDVHWWEVALAIILLGVTSWAFRLAAIKIFRLGMLLYGKEPTFREIFRWARGM